MKATEIANGVRAYFKKHDWHFDEKMTDEKDTVLFLTHMAAEDGRLLKGYAVTVVCRDDQIQAVFVPPVTVARKFFPAVSEYFGRINSQYIVGKWVLDYDDGEPRWEFVKEVENLKPGTDDVMDDLIGFSGVICDKYAEGIVKILMGNMSPEELVCDDEEDNCGDDPKPVAKTRSKKRGRPRKAKKEDAKRLDAHTNELPRDYSLKGLNIEGKIPLEEIVQAVKCFKEEKCDVDAPRLNILLSGVPGSGKTVFVKYLAHQIGMPLRTVKASDILSCFVGGTERKISRVFAEAKKKGEILFLDEMDSLLVDRHGAEHAWEVSQTNTLLQEMESFTGIVIGATNLVENLDSAVMRRFTYKLRLAYLTDEGKALFFKRYFNAQLTDEQQRRLDSIERLTPGDFRTVKESLFYLKDKQNNDARLDALAAESAAKGQLRARIGF